MRISLMLLTLSLGAAPALAQPAPLPPPPPVALAPEVQQALSDPATADRLTNVMQAMSKAFLDLPVGEVQAALEGRPPTAADRRRTVRSETGMSEGQLRAQIAQARPMVRRQMQVLGQTLPQALQGLAQAQQSIERAIANLPDPNYPRR